MYEFIFLKGIFMTLYTIITLAVGLAMDAFAASICQGLRMQKMNIKIALFISGMFGLFQGAMPLLGYVVGKQFETYITSIDHWIAFILLGLIGFNMIKESLDPENDCCELFGFNLKEIVIMAIATSIDALAVGITFAFLKVNVTVAVILIGLITFVICFGGIFIGHHFGSKYKTKAELLGGIILVCIGLKILLEHLGVL